MSQEILYSVEESIATITLNRPERMNALTHELETELHRIFDRADADRAVRVIRTGLSWNLWISATLSALLFARPQFFMISASWPSLSTSSPSPGG